MDFNRKFFFFVIKLPKYPFINLLFLFTSTSSFALIPFTSYERFLTLRRRPYQGITLWNFYIEKHHQLIITSLVSAPFS